jgi:hypothetical protein
MRRFALIALVYLAVALIAFGAYGWFCPSGTGESRHSPDGRYTASAMNMSCGTWFNGRIQYIELRVAETDGAELWRTEYHYPHGPVPDYGDRSKDRFITWAQDSSSVSIPVGGGKQVTVQVR